MLEILFPIADVHGANWVYNLEKFV